MVVSLIVDLIRMVLGEFKPEIQKVLRRLFRKWNREISK